MSVFATEYFKLYVLFENKYADYMTFPEYLCFIISEHKHPKILIGRDIIHSPHLLVTPDCKPSQMRNYMSTWQKAMLKDIYKKTKNPNKQMTNAICAVLITNIAPCNGYITQVVVIDWFHNQRTHVSRMASNARRLKKKKQLLATKS